jgi:hypothetical protein
VREILKFMIKRLLAVTIFFVLPGFARGQNTPPDTSAGPVPPAIQQMPDRFQPPVPGCTDCYYTVPSGKVVGAMGTTNNEGIVVKNPITLPVLPKPAAAAAAGATASNAAPSVVVDTNTYSDLIFKSGDGVWPIRSTSAIPLFIGSPAGLSRDASRSMVISASCDLHSVEYSTQAGTITTLNIPLSLWDVTTKTLIADLPTNWNSWQIVKYPSVSVDKRIPAGHRLQVKVVQPASATLPVNFQFTINVAARCLKDTKGGASSPSGPKAIAPATKCQAGYKPVSSSNGTTCVKQ